MGNDDIGVVAGDTMTSQRFYFGKSRFLGYALECRPQRTRSLNHLVRQPHCLVPCHDQRCRRCLPDGPGHPERAGTHDVETR